MPDTGEPPILRLRGFSAGYLDEPIVRDFDLEVAPRTITTLIGPNGAGKSTLMKAIFGLIRQFGGEIAFDGRDIATRTPAERLRLGLGFVPQGRCNFPLMTVRENLELGAYSLRRGEVGPAVARVLARFPILRERFEVLAGNLSGGEQQILEMAMVMEASPTLLLLDEPSLGLSPINQEQVFETIANIRGGGVTVMVVEQNAYGALRISDTAVVLELGRKLLEGPAREVTDDPRVRTAYLGGQV
jgi:branched-chain amino acid transport system ATP-binding protein